MECVMKAGYKLALINQRIGRVLMASVYSGEKSVYLFKLTFYLFCLTGPNRNRTEQNRLQSVCQNAQTEQINTLRYVTLSV